VSRTGHFQILTITPDGPRFSVVYEDAMGKGRLALRPSRPGQPTVVYTTHDDGRILRHERRPAGWTTETIFLGPLGPRGIAAGAFGEGPDVETVAIFGYSGRVQLLTRGDAGWTAETIFVDRDKGHWLASGELDGRNGTPEIVLSGYSGRIVLLSRPPGYGRRETADAADAEHAGTK
jgi:hypothetical protein